MTQEKWKPMYTRRLVSEWMFIVALFKIGPPSGNKPNVHLQVNGSRSWGISKQGCNETVTKSNALFLTLSNMNELWNKYAKWEKPGQ